MSKSIENGRKRKNTDGIEGRKEPKFGQDLRISQKNCPGGCDLTDQKKFPSGCPGGCKQSELTETHDTTT